MSFAGLGVGICAISCQHLTAARQDVTFVVGLESQKQRTLVFAYSVSSTLVPNHAIRVFKQAACGPSVFPLRQEQVRSCWLLCSWDCSKGPGPSRSGYCSVVPGHTELAKTPSPLTRGPHEGPLVHAS